MTQKCEHPLRILVVTECFYPDIYAVNDIVEQLVLRGHKVTVLTGLPDYTTTEIPPEYRHGRNRHQNYKGADVYRVSTIARHHGPIWRSLSYLSFVWSGSFRARSQDWKKQAVWGTDIAPDFDVIYVWEVSPVTMAVPALALKKRYHKPVFLYCMDIWPECVKAMGIKEGTPPYKLIHRWTKSIYKRCDHIAVSSRPFFEYLNEINGIPFEKMSYLPQYASTALLKQDFTKESNENHIDFLFIGNLGKAQNLDCLIEAMTIFKGNTDVTLHIVGGGSEAERIQRLTHDLGLDDQIRFYGPKPFAEAVSFYKKADACVLTLDGGTHIGDTLPGKLQTYMAAGKPVLAAANGATQEVISESQCGGCVPAGDTEAFGKQLQEYVIKPDMYKACGDKARKYFVENFTSDKHFRALEQKLWNLVQSKR